MSEPAPLLSPLKAAVIEPHIWKGTEFVTNPWQSVSDDEPLPIDGYAIVSLARWRAEQAALAESNVPIGVIVLPPEAIDPATDDIARLAVIALAFPKFTDGRAYSMARRLRETGYANEIRATGDVLLDQIPLMLRAGFDAFEITNAATVRALQTSPLPAVSRVYQVGAESVARDWQSRRAIAGREQTRKRASQ